MLRIRLVLADDQPLVLEAFRALLEPEFNVVGTATSARQLVAECARTKPDVVVLDSTLRLLAALQLREIRLAAPATRLVLLTSGDQADASDAQRLGAAVVPKSSDARELRRAIRADVRKQAAVGESAARTATESGDRAVPGLTARQLEVLGLLADGHSMKEVAAILAVTARTVAFHKYKMMNQLNVATTAELVQFAVKHGVVSK